MATWLIPVLIAAGWWRHRVHRVPLTYQATLWSVVFPLGMYAVAGSTSVRPSGYRSSAPSARSSWALIACAVGVAQAAGASVFPSQAPARWAGRTLPEAVAAMGAAARAFALDLSTPRPRAREDT